LNFLHDLQWILPLRSPELTRLALAFSWLGYTTFIMFFMAIGYWTWSKAIFFRLLILVAINAMLNAYVKDLFQDPRPPLALRLDDMVGASYGLPSGHAQLAVVMWMWLAWELRRTWAWILGSVITFGVIASRLYLGVHDVEDVVVGAALGGASLLIFERARHWQFAFQTQWGWSVLAIATGTTLALFTWPGTAPEYIPTLAGWLAIATWSLQFDKLHLGYTAPKALWRKLAVGLLGAACFMGEQKLLKLLGSSVAMQPILWAPTKGLVSGAFVSLLMPLVFAKLRLATSSPAHSSIASH
jgi:membrane-associated phospholipid phosphatase